VLLGNGDGTFSARVSYDGGDSAARISTADVNGDGVLDIVSTSQNDDKINILLGNGDGTFKSRVSYDGGSDAYGISTADVNGDGAVDIVSTSKADNKISVLLSNTTQTTTIQRLNLASQSEALASMTVI